MAQEELFFDVVVVGGGGAGLAAAIEAKDAGAAVLLIEKNHHLGGSTAWSIGSVTATQTPHQKKKGIVDSPADHWADMPGFAGDLSSRDNDELRKVLCDEMPETFQWLLDSGVRFMGPMPEPPHRQPRMHNVLPNSRSFIYHLERRALRAGVQIQKKSRVMSLLFEEGRVKGALMHGPHGKVKVWAKKGVILAAGDFTNSPELKARFMGEQASKVEAVNETATGDGQLMAEQLGAEIVNGDLALGPELRFIAPAKENFLRRLPPWGWLADLMAWSIDHVPQTLLSPFMMKFLTTALAPSTVMFEAGAILVNQHGERFGDENDKPSFKLPEQEGKVGFILLDRKLIDQFSSWPFFISTAPGIAYAFIEDYRKNRPDVYCEAQSITDLALKLGMNPQTLTQSAASGTRRPLEHGPVVALGPVRSVFVHNEGGLRVDQKHRVLNRDRKVLQGLFAVGSTGQGGLLLKGHGHHLAWAFVSGRRAGRLAATDPEGV